MLEASKSKVLFLPPLMRFIVELTIWIWLLLAAIFVYWGFALLLALSLLSLALLNYPGDKRSVDSKNIGLSIPGWTRISVEIVSTGLGINAGFFYGEHIYIGLVILIPQIVITLISFSLDFKRWLWMLGKLDDPPNYVTAVHKS